jgi:hypothetical protein
MNRLAVALPFLLSGCVTSTLTLAPVPVVDLTVPKRAAKQFASIMVLPPSGSERGQASELAAVERVLLGAGIKVISSGVTGRIVLDGSGNRVETGANLSDLERALVLARNSNAEALLQVTQLGWIDDGRRWFVRSGERFQEIGPGHTLDAANSVKVREAVFHFQAKVISVDKGEIVMSIDASQGTSRVLQEPKGIEITTSLAGADAREIETDMPDRRQSAVDQVMAVLLARLTAQTATGESAPP